ncbi:MULTISPECIES: HvfC/BufC N-terminal domain-containing protein [Pseudomonas]|uniref:HvfC/BufC N-terminal domain-containing protein n=1 Tax=Pseudomonas TaxID=286 RepID=UPI001BE8D354|nr:MULTISPECIES: putative DNA-binding domain-containing protein [Pseudomonas]MBT2339211.1 putative DNA-binding domain-containing protein [Pseudomonas fluorescens]MCD4529486.1 putative DNA-binding domain-containing protein [Pseudomonas sp. C3-2018]
MSNQAAFAAALLDPRQACPPGLCCANGADPASRFAVYRNNVQGSLINALADGYPVVRQLVGDAFFRAMAGVHVQASAPQSPLMNRYGEGLADFIEGFGPASAVPYLADVARLERLRTVAYHAADAQPLGLEQIAVALTDPHSLDDLCITFHPSLHLLDSAFAVVAIWAAHQTGATLADIDPSQGQHALVLRNGLDVEVFALDPGACTFIRHLQNGQPLGQALACAPAFDIEHTLALLISHSAITGLHHDKVLP